MGKASIFYALVVLSQTVVLRGEQEMARGTFKLKDNPKRWMEVKNPPWTSRRLAERLGFDETYVSQVFSGRKVPSWRFLAALAELTGLHDGGELVYYDPSGVEANGSE